MAPDPESRPSADDLGVSHETFDRLGRFVALLRQWQQRINLIAPGTEAEIWTRHIRDSLQLVQLAPGARHWIDLGSGGGFPGLVIACALGDGVQVTMIESNRKKAAFLQHVVTELRLPCIVVPERIEGALERLPKPDVVSARALAPLADLIAMTKSLLKSGAIALFPKGRDYQRELTDALQTWHFSYRLHNSVTDPEARIIEIRMDPGISPP